MRKKRINFSAGLMQTKKLVFCFCFLVSMASAQTHHFRNYSVEHGLPFIQVYTIYQDHSGYLWSGGYGGLSRFDGKNFVNYSPRNGLLNHWVTSIAEDDSGTLWVGTIKGVSRFDGQRFKNYTPESGLANEFVTAIASDHRGNMWIGTKNGLTRYDGKKFENFSEKDGLPSSDILSVAADSSGSVWIGTSKGLCRFVIEKKFTETKKFQTQFSGLTGCDSSVNHIAAGRNGELWIAAGKGVVRYDGKNSICYNASNGLDGGKVHAVNVSGNGNVWIASDKGLFLFDEKKFLRYDIEMEASDKKVSSLFTDFEGNTWLGTHAGLFRYRKGSFRNITRKDGLKSTFVFPVFKDRKGNLWVGTEGGGLYRYANNRLTQVASHDGIVSDTVYAGIEDRDGILWFGIPQGLLKYDGESFSLFTEKNGLKTAGVKSILQVRDGRIWLGGRNGVAVFNPSQDQSPVFKNYDVSTGKNDIDVWSILEDKKGKLWFGTYLGGLISFDGTHFENAGKKLGLTLDSYLSLLQDRNGNYYFGTLNGVYRYDGKRLINFSEKDGLSSDLIYAMVFDKEERILWAGTNQGVSKIEIGTFSETGKKRIESYGKEEGFLGVECNSNGAFREADGTLWFGTVNGLVKFSPKEYFPNKTEPKIIITGIRLFYRDTILPPHAKLSHNLNNISFFFTGISLTNPQKVKYSYILEGLYKKWSPPSEQNVATFASLAPGRYTFKVRACNNEGIWSSVPAVYSFSVAAPFWSTWWFIAAATLTVLFSVFGFARFRLRTIRAKERTEMNQKIQLATNELKALRAQINPHFIFNSLNSIQNFIRKNNSEISSLYLNKFARLMRIILNNSEKSSVTLREELDALRLYLELESVRFENKFEFEIKVEDQINQDLYEIPSMLIQPYVENAILHGLIPRETKGKLIIELKQNESHIVCSVTDNGIGRDQSAVRKGKLGRPGHIPMGMKITEDRLHLINSIHKYEVSVKVSDLTASDPHSTGTRVDIFIPIA